LSAFLKTNQFSLEPADNKRLADLCGQCDENLRQIEKKLHVKIHNRGNHFQVVGEEKSTELARTVLLKLYQETHEEHPLSPAKIHLFLKEVQNATLETPANNEEIGIRTKNGLIKARSSNQQAYLKKILSHDINFGIGPAGTGKTYLAVACAVNALEKDLVSRLILVRPAVEAGERLGFLPGDLSQKVDPYLRPLYDALYEMLGAEKVVKLLEKNVIEIAPLAYMRGRTLNDSYIILDEGQNTTREQMKMFLTRIGFGSTAVITGDVTQIDLPKGIQSGLKHAMEVLKNIPGISFTHFAAHDVVRHPLVQDIVKAYHAYEENQSHNK
jgi:phosphate starvation-inducible PhoH-like protein